MAEHVRAPFEDEPIIDPQKMRFERIYDEGADEVYRENVDYLRVLFNTYAGKGKGSNMYGGIKQKLLTSLEWTELVKGLAIFSPNFTYRESVACFSACIMQVKDPYRNWRRSVAIDFPSFCKWLLSANACTHARPGARRPFD